MTEEQLNRSAKLLESKRKAEEILKLDLCYIDGISGGLIKHNWMVTLNDRLAKAIHSAIKNELEVINKEIEEL